MVNSVRCVIKVNEREKALRACLILSFLLQMAIARIKTGI